MIPVFAWETWKLIGPVSKVSIMYYHNSSKCKYKHSEQTLCTRLTGKNPVYSILLTLKSIFQDMSVIKMVHLAYLLETFSSQLKRTWKKLNVIDGIKTNILMHALYLVGKISLRIQDTQQYSWMMGFYKYIWLTVKKPRKVKVVLHIRRIVELCFNFLKMQRK